MCAAHPGVPLPEPDRPDVPIAALVGRAQAGDEAAFERVARWCYPRVYRWALARSGDPDDADDVTQDVLVLVRRHLPSYAGRSQFSTWLYRITANAAAGLASRRARHDEVLQRWSREAGESAGDSGDRLDDLHAAAIGELVQAFFKELPDRQREVFDLGDLQGYSSVEIAEMLELEPSTVRARAMRAKILERHPELGKERDS